MYFSELPDSILTLIALTTDSQRDINALAQSSRRLYQVFLLPLYTVNFLHHDCSAVFYLSAHGYEHALLQLLHLVPQMSERARWRWPIRMSLFLVHPSVSTARFHGILHSPLIDPVRNGHAGIVRILLGVDINPNYSAVDMRMPLAIAAQNGHVAVIEALLAYGANIYERRRGTDTGTPLIDAVEYGQPEALRCLLDALRERLGPTSSVLVQTSQKAFQKAVYHDKIEALQLLLEVIGEADCSLPVGMTGLMIAAEQGHVRTMQVLLDAGADPDLVTGREGYTALIYAALRGKRQAAQLLLDVGADPDARDSLGRTPLSHAAEHGHIEVVIALAQAGADVGTVDEDVGWTAEEWALSQGHMSIVRVLRSFRNNRVGRTG